MPKIHKYRDWSGWWDGMRAKALKAGAEAIGTSATALLGTNGVASMQIPGLTDIGMGWKTALATMFIQFSLRVVAAGAAYVQAQPEPELITEVTDTQQITKSTSPTP